MKSTRTRLFVALFALALASVFIAGLSWAQGTDTPIIISDGSLNMESRGATWAQFTGSGATKRHPNPNKSVTGIDLTVNGRSQSIAFSGQQCNLTVQYGSTTISITTGGDGKGLQLSTDFSSFHNGANANFLAHNNTTGHIGTVSVTKGGTSAFNGTGNGGTVITIHYR